MCFWASVALRGCIICLNLPQIPPFLKGPSAKWDLAEDDSFPITSCSPLSRPLSSQYQLSPAKENKPSISFACFTPYVFLLFYFYWHFHVESRRVVNRALLNLLFVFLSSPSALCLMFYAISESLGVSFGDRSCSASDSADSRHTCWDDSVKKSRC